MAAYDVVVKKLLATQGSLKNRPEHCSVDPDKLATIGRAGGQQVRIIRNSEDYGLYTVSEVCPDSPDNVVRMGLTGRQRLGTSEEFEGVIDSRVPHPTLSEDEAEAQGEFIERLDHDGVHSGLIAIAPHGGDIERHTDQQAERVAARLADKAVSSWRCKGWKRAGGAFRSWHITSADINEASFPQLNSVISPGFTYAVAFHGFDDPEILIGGIAPGPLKQEIRAAVEGATAGSGIEVRIAQPDEGFGGDDPQNIVNRLTVDGASGIQIEQCPQARIIHWTAIADAVANVYYPKL